ncbi:MAG: hypothetical protein R3F61_25220 [Myxococcota bacterium]
MNPPDLRRIAHLALVPLMLLSERFGYYLSRAFLVIWLTDAVGMELGDAYETYSAMALLITFAPLLGGVAAALVGPYIPLLLGASGMIAAYLGIWAIPSSSVPLLFLLALAQGLVKPGVWTLAAVQFTRTFGFARTAYFTLLYIAINLGGLFGPMVAGWVSDAFGMGLIFAVAAAATAVLLPTTAALWAAGHAQEWPEPELEPGLRAAGIAIGTALCAAPFWALTTVSGDSSFQAATNASMSSAEIAMLMGVNPMIILAGGLFAIVAWAIAQVLSLRVPDLVFAGIALLAASLGAMAVHPAVVGLVGMTGLGIGNVAMALCEVIAIPVVLSRVSADSHWRAVPLLLAGWMVAGSLAGWSMELVGAAIPPEISLPLAGFVTGAGGVLLVLASIAGRRMLLPVVDAPEPA